MRKCAWYYLKVVGTPDATPPSVTPRPKPHKVAFLLFFINYKTVKKDALQLYRPTDSLKFVQLILLLASFVLLFWLQTESDTTVDWTQITREYGGLHNYPNTMGLESTWADEIIIETAMHYYNRPIVVLYSGCERKIQFSHNRLPCSSEPLQIGYVSTAGNEILDHYVSLTRELNDVSDWTYLLKNRRGSPVRLKVVM